MAPPHLEGEYKGRDGRGEAELPSHQGIVAAGTATYGILHACLEDAVWARHLAALARTTQVILCTHHLSVLRAA